MADERFIKTARGAVYRYSETLAQRKDAVLVDGFAAARHFRSLGVTNDVTEAYPERAMDEGAIPEATRRPPRNQSKRASPKKAGVVVSKDEVPVDAVLEELLGENGKDVS